MLDGKVLDRIGNTPLRRVEGIFVKLECANPAGSVKDRVARFLLEEASRRGELRPGDTVVETTSGNTGIALSLVARRLGHRVLIFMPEHMSVERRRMLAALGAEVCLTPRAEGFEGAIARRDAFRGRPGHYVPDQFGNPDNSRCHFLTTGLEIVAQLRAMGIQGVDWLVAGVGTGGTLMGVGARLRQAMPGVRVAAVEPAESAVLSGGAPGEHGIQGIGDGFVPDLVDRDAIDQVVQVSSDEASAEARRLHLRHGFCVGVSSGANTVAARRLARPGATVVTLWPDCSDRYVSLGLEAPVPGGGGCEHRGRCATRMRDLLAG